MIVLALDTAAMDCAAGIYDAGAGVMLSQVTETIGKGHAERLIAIIDRALEQAGLTLQDVGRIGVTIGPGSFTGIRVGVAAARGFALSLGVEAVGVSTLAILANARLATDATRPVVAAMDAKRDEIYAQAFDVDGAPLSEPAALSLAEVKALRARYDAGITGSAACLLDEGKSLVADVFPIDIAARLASAVKDQFGKPKPLYLRSPDARPQDGFALSRL